MKKTKTVTVYKDKISGLLSFWKEGDRKEYTPLWDFRSGLSKITIEEFVEILERVEDTSQYNFFCARFFYFGKTNVWVPGSFIRDQGFRDRDGNYCLGCGYILGAEEVTNLKGLLKYFIKRKTPIKVGPIYGVKSYPVEWEEVYKWHLPFYLVLPLKEGHPLHYPEGHYIHVGDDREVVRNWEEIEHFLPESFRGMRIHVLIYPNGCAMLTNGVAGNPTFWSQLQKNGSGW